MNARGHGQGQNQQKRNKNQTRSENTANVAKDSNQIEYLPPVVTAGLLDKSKLQFTCHWMNCGQFQQILL